MADESDKRWRMLTAQFEPPMVPLKLDPRELFTIMLMLARSSGLAYDNNRPMQKWLEEVWEQFTSPLGDADARELVEYLQRKWRKHVQAWFDDLPPVPRKVKRVKFVRQDRR